MLPAHDQLHGPLPDTAPAVPVAQRLVEGALATVVPFAEPQVPLTTLEVFAWHVNDTWVDGLQAHWFAFVVLAACTHHV